MGLSVSLKTFGKYLDQPDLINRINKCVPPVITALGGAYVIHETVNTHPEDRKKKFIQSASVMFFAISSALIAARGLKIKGKKIFGGLIHLPHTHEHEICEHIHADTQKPFEELKKLSILGLIPVLGGIFGGVAGEVITKDNWKKKFPNKIKEGAYQYINNIFLCNVGAGLAMLAMNKMNVQNKAARFTAMLAGVILVGLVAGSAIANFVGKKIINPIFNKKENITHNPPKDFTARLKDLNSERHPEAVDLSLHIDDIASVGFLTGFKWIGPIIPALYAVSGYRAGIGYRNGEKLN